MKKFLPAVLLALLLTGCSAGEASPSPAESAPALTPQEAAQAVLDAGAFSEELEAVDADVAAALYALEPDSIAGTAAYLSTGATAEECTFLLATDGEAADAALTALQKRVEDQLAALADYQPGEIAKLEKALSGSRPVADGTLVYLVVAESPDAAQAALDGLGK